jgi:hypothetical protein
LRTCSKVRRVRRGFFFLLLMTGILAFGGIGWDTIDGRAYAAAHSTEVSPEANTDPFAHLLEGATTNNVSLFIPLVQSGGNTPAHQEPGAVIMPPDIQTPGQNLEPNTPDAPDQTTDETPATGLTLCPGLSAAGAELATLMYNHSQQQRAALICDLILTRVAQTRAEDMAQRDYVGHETPEGFGPNHLVMIAGYPLPESYIHATNANNIESLGAGSPTVEAVWTLWLSLSTHRTHLLGLTSFFAAQTRYGVGYVHRPGSAYGHYWVVLTAPPPSE